MLHLFVTTPVGNLVIYGDGQKIKKITFVSQQKRSSSEKINGVLKKTQEWVQNYFIKGGKKPFPLKYLDFSQGTPFQQKVWQALWSIPFGKRVSYAEIAQKIGSPQTVRAVGNANGQNPLPLLIPCHRVICSDGSIGGYSAGVKLKRKLLKHEGVII